MKKAFMSVISITIVAIIIVSVCIVGLAETQKKTFVLLGDSISAGSGILDTRDMYGYIIADHFGFRQINCAVGGQKTSDLILQLQNSEKTISNVESADIVGVSIGGNNALQMSQADIIKAAGEGIDGETITNLMNGVKQDLLTILSQIRKLNPNCHIMLQNLYDMTSATTRPEFVALKSLVSELIIRFASCVDSVVATDENAVTVNVYSEFDDHYKETQLGDYIQSDGIHPSVDGHAAIARVYISLLEKDYPTAASEQTTVDPTVETYTIIIETYLYGDVNFDWKVNGKDVLRLKQFLAEWKVEAITHCSDVNNDTAINAKDLLLIREYLAGYKVENVGTIKRVG